MTFFPDPPEPFEPHEPDNYPPLPVWLSAPLDMIPGVVAVELTLGRSEAAAVFLSGIRAFPSGLDMILSIRCRSPAPVGELSRNFFEHRPEAGATDAEWEAARLKWGFEFADGRRVTNVDPTRQEQFLDPWQPSPAIDSPVLSGVGGGGGDRSWDGTYWLWPLPPPGRLRVACQWLAQGVAETVQDLDGQPFLDAAERSRPIWPLA